MRIYSLFIFLFLLNASGYAQEYGLPLLKNYLPKEFIYEPQVYCVTQDNRGIMYMGITDYGLLEYDGAEWRGIPNNLKSEVYGVVIDKKGTTYLGSANDFGYLFTEKNGKNVYKSLKDQYIDSATNIGIVWNTHLIDDNVYFFTEKCVYIFNITSLKINSLKPPDGGSFYVPFIFRNKYYLLQEKKGILRYENNKLTLIPKTSFFSDKQFLSAIPYSETSVLIPTRNSGVYLVELNGNNSVEQFNLKPSNEFIKDNDLYTALSLDSGRFLIGSKEKGAVIVEHDGQIISHINEKTGLQNSLVLASNSDFNGNIWLALSLGISRLDSGKDISFWDKSSGLLGNIYDIIRFDKKIYLVTNQNIYHLVEAGAKTSLSKYIISEIDGIPPGQNWCLTNFKVPGNPGKEILLAGTQNGIFEISGNESRQIYKGELHAFQITQSDKFPQRIYSTDGFTSFISLLYKNGTWVFEGKWKGINDDIREIIEDKHGNLWLETFTNGVLNVTIDYQNITKPKLVKRYTLADGLPFISGNKPIKYKDSIIFGTGQGLYFYDLKKKKFEPYLLACKEFDNLKIEIKNFTKCSNGNIYLSSRNNSAGLMGYLKPVENGYSWIYKPFRRLPDMASISAIYSDPDGTVWIGSNEGLYKYDPNKDYKNYNIDFKCLIRRITIGKDSIVYWGNHTYKSLMKTQGISYDYNNLKFNFAAPFFEREDETKYSYLLEGYDENWSPWSTSNYKDYTKVKEGKYTFKVRAINIFDKESSTAEYQIQILPPWYRNTLAYIFYAIGFGLLFIFSMRIYSRMHVKLKQRLEKTIEERTKEILKQKYKLQSQAEEMAVQSEELHEKAVILSQINEELEKLSIVARETDNAITIIDETGHFLWVNDGFTRLYGYTMEEYLEKSQSMAETDPESEITEYIRHCIDSKESKVFESSVITKAGKKVYIQTMITPIFGFDGRIEKLVAIDSDITKLKEADLEIKRKNQEILLQKEELEQHRNHLERIVKKRTAQLEIAKNKAEESDRLKSAFLANMSHEIRTPMNAIIGFSDLLSIPDTTPEQKEEFARLIANSGNSLLQLIEDIIEIAKIEAGQLKIENTKCNLFELLVSLKELYAQRIDNIYMKDIQLNLTNVNDEKYIVIETDPFRLKQLITNLLENAIKFTEKGIIEFGYEPVEFENTAYLKFYVKDTGIGLSHDQKDIIFERFTKIENQKTRLYRGAGLGLAICQNIVKLLGGEIMVESKLNKGSTFSFTIPYVECEIGNKKLLPVKNDKSVWIAKKILIAEDDDINFRFIEAILKKTGVIIVRAKNGKEAVEKVRDSLFDLILMDIKMPVMDGLKATKIIRRSNKEIPVIAFTAFAAQDDESLCLEAGCNSYVSKPIHSEMFFSVLKRYLD